MASVAMRSRSVGNYFLNGKGDINRWWREGPWHNHGSPVNMYVNAPLISPGDPSYTSRALSAERARNSSLTQQKKLLVLEESVG